MSWPVPFEAGRINLHTPGRDISEDDAKRQIRTVSEILTRLVSQPGLILADEVGMGKTFVALAVAASVAWADRGRRPVVVLVPSSLKDKWPRDFGVFRSRCLVRPEDRDGMGLTCEIARSGVEFFKLLDDAAGKRPHIIFLTHGSLSTGLTDPWTKLAILRHALRSPRLQAQRRAFPRFAPAILRVASTYWDAGLFERLMASPVNQWRTIIARWEVDEEFSAEEMIGDDPVPQAVQRVIERGAVSMEGLRQELEQLPLRESKYVKDRLDEVRWALATAMQEVWQGTLHEARFRSPLIILDEAHHLKNPATRLASLFVEASGKEDADVLDGPLQGKFERMLFLTATPFQLGHYELLSVLSRFRYIDWGTHIPGMRPDDFDKRLGELTASLNEAQAAVVNLEDHWARLRPDDLAIGERESADMEGWWRQAISAPATQPERVGTILRLHGVARDRMRAAEQALSPWVIRHLRPRNLPDGGPPRRVTLPGGAIRPGHEDDIAGLGIDDQALLPFLLLARTQAILAGPATLSAGRVSRRATFAEGLASSYEAFLETRAVLDDAGMARTILDEDSLEDLATPSDGLLGRYLDRLRSALPNRSVYAAHPKVAPTVERAVSLWGQGEKVLIFCHFRATGASLARHLSAAIGRRVEGLAAAQIGCDRQEAWNRLEQVGDRFDKEGPLRRRLDEVVRNLVADQGDLTPKELDLLQDVVRRFVSSPYYLVRHWPLKTRDSTTGFDSALGKSDASGLSLQDKLRTFVGFIAKRCDADERSEYLEALHKIQTGRRRGGGGREEGDPSAADLLPNVRLANGEVKDEQRRRLMLAFNTPFFPEILVASSVLAEGVDLHLDCRNVIHHDLCWNPSTLEQRTGRVDRIGAKGERVRQPIYVFLPYVGATQDEKMYRVLKDRERWFQALMGEAYTVDEMSTERIAARIPLPEAAAAALSLRLEVWRPGDEMTAPLARGGEA